MAKSERDMKIAEAVREAICKAINYSTNFGLNPKEKAAAQSVDLSAILATIPPDPVAVPSEPGLYAIRYRDNWDGEGDAYLTLATKLLDGRWIDYESGAPLLKYEGDKILNAWPLTDNPEPVAMPEGWKLVPEEPTREMLDAAHANFRRDVEIDPLLKTSYRAMLSAAPQEDAQQPAHVLTQEQVNAFVGNDGWRKPAWTLTDKELDNMRHDSGLNFVTLREFRIIARVIVCAIEAKLKC